MRIARRETENETPIADQTSLSPVRSIEKAEIRAELESNNTFQPIKIMGNVSQLGEGEAVTLLYFLAAGVTHMTEY